MKTKTHYVCRTGVNVWPFIYVIGIHIFAFITLNIYVIKFWMIFSFGVLFFFTILISSHYLVNICLFYDDNFKVIYPLRIFKKTNTFNYHEVLKIKFVNTVSRYNQPTLKLYITNSTISFPIESMKRRKKVFEFIRNKGIKLNIDSVLDSDYKI